MPAGVTWGTYLKFTTAALLSMFAGSQAVHVVYNPLKDVRELVEAEKKRMKDEYKEYQKGI